MYILFTLQEDEAGDKCQKTPQRKEGIQKNKIKPRKTIDKFEKIGYNILASLKNGGLQSIFGEVLKLAEEAPLLRV